MSKKIVSTNNARKREVYHTDPECPALGTAVETREPTPNEIKAHDLAECPMCAGDRRVGVYPERDCPLCGKTLHSVARHLPSCPER